MIKFHRKGFDDSKLHAMFMRAVSEGDCGEIAAVVHAAGMERKPVDCMTFALKRRPFTQRSNLPKPADLPEFGSEEYSQALQFVEELSKSRDEKLETIEGPHRGYNTLSPFLAELDVDLYKPGVDYGTTAKSHKAIQSGAGIKHPVSGKKTKIVTGRDAASYVHKDDPMDPWEMFMGKILAEGHELNLPAHLFDTLATPQSNFTVYGAPFFKGLLSSALLECPQTSFRYKWQHFAPRPEESGPIVINRYVSTAFAEGSPMHPTSGQMHGYAAYLALGIILAFVKNPEKRMAYTSESVRDSGTLLAQNISAFRVIAGVHFQHDEDMIKDVALEHGRQIAEPYIK